MIDFLHQPPVVLRVFGKRNCDCNVFPKDSVFWKAIKKVRQPQSQNGIVGLSWLQNLRASLLLLGSSGELFTLLPESAQLTHFSQMNRCVHVYARHNWTVFFQCPFLKLFRSYKFFIRLGKCVMWLENCTGIKKKKSLMGVKTDLQHSTPDAFKGEETRGSCETASCDLQTIDNLLWGNFPICQIF